MSILAVYLIFSMLAVIWFDGTRYIIPNWLAGSLLLLYPLAVYTSHAGVDWKMALLGMAIVFAAGYIVFSKGWMGAGDIKLLVACALWIGWENLPEFIFTVALLGGVFSVAVWCVRKAVPYLAVKRNFTVPRLLKEGQPVPYGVAIAVGFLLMLWRGEVFVIL